MFRASTPVESFCEVVKTVGMVFSFDDYIIEGEVEEGRLYEEANFNNIIEIKEREAKRVQIFMDEANPND
jgi:type I restriction enzyme R subunit